MTKNASLFLFIVVRGARNVSPVTSGNLERHSNCQFAVCVRHLRLKSPSIPRETTRDELIDSIVHTRTREHRPLPGFKSASDYDERRHLRIDCDKVHDGIIIGNGDTICNMNYLKGIGVTHVLNTAEHHVEVNPAKYPCYGIKYYGFHVDDLPESNISRYGKSDFNFYFYSLLLQIFPNNNLLHRVSSLQRRLGGGQLRDGLVQVRLSGGRIPGHEAQDEGHKG